MSDNMFAGIEDIEVEEKRKYFQDGTYLVQVDKFVAFESTNPDHEGRPQTATEFTILEVLDEQEGSNKVGEEIVWHNHLDRNHKNQLTSKAKQNLSRLKAFAAAALGGVALEDVTAGMILGLTEADECPEDATKAEQKAFEPEFGPGEALVGTKLVVEYHLKTAKSGAFWPVFSWQYAGDEEEEEA